MAGGAAAGAAAGAAIGAAVGATIGENAGTGAPRTPLVAWSVDRVEVLFMHREFLGLEANSPDPLHERGFHLYSQTGRLSRE